VGWSIALDERLARAAAHIGDAADAAVQEQRRREADREQWRQERLREQDAGRPGDPPVRGGVTAR
jgi:hypothetical protein